MMEVIERQSSTPTGDEALLDGWNPETPTTGPEPVFDPSALPRTTQELQQLLESPQVAEVVRSNFAQEVARSVQEGWTPSADQIQLARDIARENLQVAQQAVERARDRGLWSNMVSRLGLLPEQSVLRGAQQNLQDLNTLALQNADPLTYLQTQRDVAASQVELAQSELLEATEYAKVNVLGEQGGISGGVNAKELALQRLAEAQIAVETTNNAYTNAQQKADTLQTEASALDKAMTDAGRIKQETLVDQKVQKAGGQGGIGAPETQKVPQVEYLTPEQVKLREERVALQQEYDAIKQKVENGGRVTAADRDLVQKLNNNYQRDYELSQETNKTIAPFADKLEQARQEYVLANNDFNSAQRAMNEKFVSLNEISTVRQTLMNEAVQNVTLAQQNFQFADQAYTSFFERGLGSKYATPEIAAAANYAELASVQQELQSLNARDRVNWTYDGKGVREILAMSPEERSAVAANQAIIDQAQQQIDFNKAFVSCMDGCANPQGVLDALAKPESTLTPAEKIDRALLQSALTERYNALEATRGFNESQSGVVANTLDPSQDAETVTSEQMEFARSYLNDQTYNRAEQRIAELTGYQVASTEVQNLRDKIASGNGFGQTVSDWLGDASQNSEYMLSRGAAMLGKGIWDTGMNAVGNPTLEQLNGQLYQSEVSKSMTRALDGALTALNVTGVGQLARAGVRGTIDMTLGQAGRVVGPGFANDLSGLASVRPSPLNLAGPLGIGDDVAANAPRAPIVAANATPAERAVIQQYSDMPLRQRYVPESTTDGRALLRNGGLVDHGDGVIRRVVGSERVGVAGTAEADLVRAVASPITPRLTTPPSVVPAITPSFQSSAQRAALSRLSTPLVGPVAAARVADTVIDIQNTVVNAFRTPLQTGLTAGQALIGVMSPSLPARAAIYEAAPIAISRSADDLVRYSSPTSLRSAAFSAPRSTAPVASNPVRSVIAEAPRPGLSPIVGAPTSQGASIQPTPVSAEIGGVLIGAGGFSAPAGAEGISTDITSQPLTPTEGQLVTNINPAPERLLVSTPFEAAAKFSAEAAVNAPAWVQNMSPGPLKTLATLALAPSPAAPAVLDAIKTSIVSPAVAEPGSVQPAAFQPQQPVVMPGSISQASARGQTISPAEALNSARASQIPQGVLPTGKHCSQCTPVADLYRIGQAADVLFANTPNVQRQAILSDPNAFNAYVKSLYDASKEAGVLSTRAFPDLQTAQAYLLALWTNESAGRALTAGQSISTSNVAKGPFQVNESAGTHRYVGAPNALIDPGDHIKAAFFANNENAKNIVEGRLGANASPQDVRALAATLYNVGQNRSRSNPNAYGRTVAQDTGEYLQLISSALPVAESAVRRINLYHFRGTTGAGNIQKFVEAARADTQRGSLPTQVANADQAPQPSEQQLPAIEVSSIAAKADIVRFTHAPNGEVLVAIPEDFDPTKPSMIVAYFHGNGGGPSDTLTRQRVVEQIKGTNNILVAPGFGSRPENGVGVFAGKDGFKNFLDEVPGKVAELLAPSVTGDVVSAAISNLTDAPVVVFAYSAGYQPARSILNEGSANNRIAGIALLDAGYGVKDFASWAKANPSKFLVSSYTGATEKNNLTLAAMLEGNVQLTAPQQVGPGTRAVYSVPGNHRDFVSRGSPITNVLSKLTSAPQQNVAVAQAPVAKKNILEQFLDEASTAISAVRGVESRTGPTTGSLDEEVARTAELLRQKSLVIARLKPIGEQADPPTPPRTGAPSAVVSTEDMPSYKPSPEDAEHLAQQVRALAEAEYPDITLEELAAQVYFAGLADTPTFRVLQVQVAEPLMTNKGQALNQAQIARANLLIGQRVADLMKPEGFPNFQADAKVARLTSYTAYEGPMTAEQYRDQYLWEKYQSMSARIDKEHALGSVESYEQDFTYKDITAALNANMSVRDYVINGMNDITKTNVYSAGKALDAAGIPWAPLAYYRGLERPAATGNVAAVPINSPHYNGGFRQGNAVDFGGVGWTTAAEKDAANWRVWNWLAKNGKDYGLRANFIPKDPAHVQPNGNQKILTAQRAQIAADAEALIAAAKVIPSNPDIADIAFGHVKESPFTLAAFDDDVVSPFVTRSAGRPDLRIAGMGNLDASQYAYNPYSESISAEQMAALDTRAGAADNFSDLDILNIRLNELAQWLEPALQVSNSVNAMLAGSVVQVASWTGDMLASLRNAFQSSVQEETIVTLNEVNRRAIEAANREYQQGIGLGRIQADPNELSRRAIADAEAIFREQMREARQETVVVDANEAFRRSMEVANQVWRDGIGSSAVPLDPAEIERRAIAQANAEWQRGIGSSRDSTPPIVAEPFVPPVEYPVATRLPTAEEIAQAKAAVAKAEELQGLLAEVRPAVKPLTDILTAFFINKQAVSEESLVNAYNQATNARTKFTTTAQEAIKQGVFPKEQAATIQKIIEDLNATARKLAINDARRAVSAGYTLASWYAPARFAQAKFDLNEAAKEAQAGTGILDKAENVMGEITAQLKSTAEGLASTESDIIVEFNRTFAQELYTNVGAFPYMWNLSIPQFFPERGPVQETASLTETEANRTAIEAANAEWSRGIGASEEFKDPDGLKALEQQALRAAEAAKASSPEGETSLKPQLEALSKTWTDATRTRGISIDEAEIARLAEAKATEQYRQGIGRAGVGREEQIITDAFPPEVIGPIAVVTTPFAKQIRDFVARIGRATGNAVGGVAGTVRDRLARGGSTNPGSGGSSAPVATAPTRGSASGSTPPASGGAGGSGATPELTTEGGPMVQAPSTPAWRALLNRIGIVTGLIVAGESGFQAANWWYGDWRSAPASESTGSSEEQTNTERQADTQSPQQGTPSGTTRGLGSESQQSSQQSEENPSQSEQPADGTQAPTQEEEKPSESPASEQPSQQPETEAPAEQPNDGSVVTSRPLSEETEAKPGDTQTPPSTEAPKDPDSADTRTPGAPSADTGSGPRRGSGNDIFGGGNPFFGGGSGGLGGSGIGGSGFMGGGMSLLTGLFQALTQWFTGGGEEEEEDREPQTPPQATTTPKVIVGTIVGNPSLIDVGETSTLSWSTVGVDVGSTTCAVISADFTVIKRGPANGSMESPALSESTRFGIICNTKNATDKLLNETLIRVRGDDSDPERIFTPEQVSASQTTGASNTNQSSSSFGSSGQSGNPTPQDVRTCEPEQPIDSFIRCLCEAEPNPAGCAIPPGGLR